MTGTTRCLFAILIALTACGAGAGGDAPPLPSPLPGIPNARPPRVGEWMEYIVAFPHDPLEESIRQTLIPSRPLPDSPDDQPAAPPEPTFDPEETWESMPLRLEIVAVSDADCRAVMTYAGLRHEVTIPLSGNGEIHPDDARQSEGDLLEAEVEGDDPVDPEGLEELFKDETAGDDQADEGTRVREFASHWLGQKSIDVQVERYSHPQTGFARLTSAEAPFGLVRLATADLDFVLVDMGQGMTPEFPSPETLVDPPVGKFFRR